MAPCDKNCFSCIYEDCIYDGFDYEDYRRETELDNAVLIEEKGKKRGFLTKAEQKYRRNRRSDFWKKRDKEKERAKHTNVFACGNENVLEYWKEWRRRKLGG